MFDCITMLKISIITRKILLLIYSCALALIAPAPRPPIPVLDQVIVGDAASEAAHDFSGPGTILGSTNNLPLQYPQTVTYRQIGAGANHTQDQTVTGNQSTYITVTVWVHLSLPTYVTLKIYGSDNQSDAIILYSRLTEQPPIESLCLGMVSIGSSLLQLSWFYPLPGTQPNGYGPLELTNRDINAYPRHFHYSSSVLPSQVTANRTSLRILLGGWRSVNGYFVPYLAPLDHDLKPIYRLCTHMDPFYEPLPSSSNDQQIADIDHYESHTKVPETPIYPIWTKEVQLV